MWVSSGSVEGMSMYRGYFAVNGVDPSGMMSIPGGVFGPKTGNAVMKGGGGAYLTGLKADPYINTIICDGNGSVTAQTAQGDMMLGEIRYPTRTDPCGILDAIIDHESSHARDALEADPCVCKNKPKGFQVTFHREGKDTSQPFYRSEKTAHLIELESLRDKLSEVRRGTYCNKMINLRIKEVSQHLTWVEAGTYPKPPPVIPPPPEKMKIEMTL